ncbi:MAG: hypothetical protein QOH49_2505 [Acidobacteriota bacterium]|jgi:hypothetical protein|nr:hypothetical protein [Acidobacteriota bacterium]
MALSGKDKDLIMDCGYNRLSEALETNKPSEIIAAAQDVASWLDPDALLTIDHSASTVELDLEAEDAEGDDLEDEEDPE